MASTFKTLLADDVTNTRTLLYEVYPMTGSVVSGTVSNVKTFSHGMFESVYDTDYTSASANHLFDLTVGLHSSSAWADPADTFLSKKRSIYNQLAQVLVGYDITGSILRFDADGDITTTGDKYTEVIAIPFSRLVTKDQIKKGTFQLQIGTGPFATPFDDLLTITDSGSATEYRTNSPVGEYGFLSCSLGGAYDPVGVSGSVGLVFYQAGVAILDYKRIFASASVGGALGAGATGYAADDYLVSDDDGSSFLENTGSSIDSISEAFRHRIANLEINNTLESNDTIYFCRLAHNDFNYSSSPTFVSGSRIRTKQFSTDQSSTYPTAIGLYSSDNALLGYAKLSEPLRKSSDQDIVVRVRVAY